MQLKNLTGLDQFCSEQSALLTALLDSAEHSNDATYPLLAEYVSRVMELCDFSCSVSPFSALNDADGELLQPLHALICEIYGAVDSRISLGGTSGANCMALGHVLRRIYPTRQTVLVDSACHKSVIGPLMDMNFEIIWVAREMCPRTQVCKALSPDSFLSYFKRYGRDVAAVVVTDPSYEGLFSDLAEISRISSDMGALLYLDRAWSPLAGAVPSFGPAPLAFADIASTSLHKKGLAPSMVSATMFRSLRHARYFDEASTLGKTTTSPNWMLLMLAEHRLTELVTGGFKERLDDLVLKTVWLRKEIARVAPKVIVIEPELLGGIALDPSHLTLCVSDTGRSGYEFADQLQRDFDITVEMASPTTIILLLGPDHVEQFGTIAEGIAACAQAGRGRNPLQSPSAPILRSSRTQPADALYTAQETVGLHEAIGRIASDFRMCYPPGQSIIAPGQRITSEQIAYIEHIKALGGEVFGLSGIDGDTINVVANSSPGPRSCVVGSDEDMVIESYRCQDLPVQIAARYPDFYREIFCNPPYNQYLIDPNNPLEPKSAAEVLLDRPSGKSDYLPISELDDVANWDEFWMHPDVTRTKLLSRFLEEGYFTAVLDKRTRDFRGFFHVRIVPLRTIAETEEWANPHFLAKSPDPALAQDVEALLQRIEAATTIKPDDPIIYTSAQALHPSLRGRDGIFLKMMEQALEQITPEHATLPSMAEIPDHGAARLIDIATNDQLLPGILPNGHDLIYTAPAQRVMNHFMQGPAYFKDLLRQQLRKAKRAA